MCARSLTEATRIKRRERCISHNDRLYYGTSILRWIPLATYKRSLKMFLRTSTYPKAKTFQIGGLVACNEVRKLRDLHLDLSGVLELIFF